MIILQAKSTLIFFNQWQITYLHIDFEQNSTSKNQNYTFKLFYKKCHYTPLWCALGFRSKETTWFNEMLNVKNNYREKRHNVMKLEKMAGKFVANGKFVGWHSISSLSVTSLHFIACCWFLMWQEPQNPGAALNEKYLKITWFPANETWN